MKIIYKLKFYILIFLILILNNSSFAVFLPETPDGKIGKNYQTYSFLSTGIGITKKNFDYGVSYYNLGIRSNLGSDWFDFGIFYNLFFYFMGISADIKYGPVQTKNFSCAFDFSFSKPFKDGWITKSGAAVNLGFLYPFEFILSSYLIYSQNEMTSNTVVSFPEGYSMYFYGGIEFYPPFIIDSTITLGCGYLHTPQELSDAQKFFNQFYINIFARYALFEPKIEKKSMTVNNIIINEQEKDNINKYILMAKELIKLNELNKAILILSDALCYYPDNYMLNYLIADCYYKAKEKKKAYIYFKKASEINSIDFSLKKILTNLEMEIDK